MDIRLHEIHPALVHFPLALVPLSIGSDILGKAMDKPNLTHLGRQTIVPAALSALTAGVAGIIAQEQVRVEQDDTRRALITHRNLNLGATLGLGLLAWRRLSYSRKSTPGIGYLGAGLGLMAGLTYTAYLGGSLVYRHGLGVEKANGVSEKKSVDYAHDDPKDLLRQSAKSLAEGTKHLAQELGDGEILPEFQSRDSL